MDTTTRAGTHFKQIFDSDGNSIGSYPVSIPDSVFQQMIAEKDKQRLEQAKAAQVAIVPSLSEPTAAERIAKKYDERISAAREQCSSSKDSCDTGCTAGAAVSLLSVWAGKGAGANEAGVQIQQCSDRCKEAKNSCDQQVSALKQEKKQAIAAAAAPKLQQATAPQRPIASSSMAAQASPSASTAKTGHSSSSSNKWPAGVEPGNLYLIGFRASDATVPGMRQLLVAAKSRSDAVTLLETKWAEYTRRWGREESNLVLDVGPECTGPNWGAIVIWVDHSSNRSRSGSACGAKTPREAIIEATKACSAKSRTSCDSPQGQRDWLDVFIGHSGAKPWRDPVFGSSIYPPVEMQFSALGAGTRQSTHEMQLVKSPQEAISQFGKECINDPETIKSCWVTSKNISCIFNIDSATQGKCVDTKLTAEGYLP